MTPKQQIFHKSLIRALHLSKRYKEYYSDNKQEYREMLDEHFGVSSSKELCLDELIVFVDYMNFKADELPTKRRVNESLCSEAQLKMMRGLWSERARDKSEEALLSFAKRVLKKHYLHLHMISKSEAQKLIPVLQKMKKNIVVIK